MSECGFSLSLSHLEFTQLFESVNLYISPNLELFFPQIYFSPLLFTSLFLLYFWNPNDLSVGSFGIIPQLPETPLSYLFSVCSSDQIISCAQIKFTNSFLSPILSLCPSSEVIYSDVLSFSSKVSTWGNSLVVQRLRLRIFAAKDKGSLPGQGGRILQTKKWKISEWMNKISTVVCFIVSVYLLWTSVFPFVSRAFTVICLLEHSYNNF